MRKHKKLALSRETVRKLTGPELRNVVGGSEPTSGPPPCTVVSPYPTCTSCPTEGLCGGDGSGWCGPGGTVNDSCIGCTLLTQPKGGGN
jgi:hypothetical protein